jgi:DNA repair exonuclease SbcCD ATPase subunit
MDALGTEIASLEKDLAGIRSDLESQGALMREAHNLAKIAGQLGEATGEWEDVQERTLAEISRRERLENEIAALGYDPGEEKALDDELDALEAPMKELAVITDRLEGRQALLEKIRDQEARIRQLQAERAAISRERDELGFDPELHRRLEAEFRSMDERHRRYLDLRPGMNRLQVLEDQAAGLRSRDDMLEKAAAGLRSAIHTIAFSREDLSRAKGDLGSLHQLILEVTSRLEKTRSGKIQLEGERERLDAHLEKVEREKREYDRLSREIELLDLTREHLNGFTDHLLGVVRDQIQEETGRILSEITDGRYDTVILDDAFELLVHDLGGDFPVSRFSGGEQDDVAIALRIALSRNIAEMHELHDSTFLIFDEIFGSQDEERRGNILRALRALEPYFPQIFLISHVTEVQGEFGNTLLVEAVSGTESRIRDLEGVEA